MWHGIQRRTLDLFMKRKVKDLKEFNKLYSVFVFPSSEHFGKHEIRSWRYPPDNEALHSLGKAAPQTPAACQGETEERLTNLAKVPRKGATFEPLLFLT